MTDFSTLCTEAESSGRTALENLKRIESALRLLQSELGKLPFFVRGFVTSEIGRGTGQDLAAWGGTMTQMQTTLQAAQEAVGRARAAGALAPEDRAPLQRAVGTIAEVQPQIGKLAEFMEKAPARVSTVPSAMLPEERKGEFLQMVERQSEALSAMLTALPPLSATLTALSDGVA